MATKPRTKREKILMAATLAAILGWIVYPRLEDARGMGGLITGGGELEVLREQYQEYRRILERDEAIRKSWSEVEKPYEVPAGMTTAAHFSEMTHALCAKMQFQGVQIEPPKLEPIPEVEEYGLLFLEVKFVGPWDRVAQLLKLLESSGYLIDGLTVTSPMDSPTIAVELRLARPVKLSKDEIERMKGGGNRYR